MGSFIILSVHVIREAYQMLHATHWLVRVQGVGEDMPSNMFLLSTLSCWNFTKHTSWLSIPRLPKYSQRDSWDWIIAKDEMTYLGLCCHFVYIWAFVGEATFHEYERGNISRELWFITWALSIYWCWWCHGP